MKTIIIIIIIMFTGISAFGQNHIIGLKSGMNRSNVSADYEEANNQYKLGYTGGLTYEYHINKRFQLGVDVIYSQEGFKNGINNYMFGTLSGFETQLTYKYNYISVPIKAGITFGDKFSGFVNLGIIPSFMVNSKIIVGYLGFDDTREEDANNFVNKYELGGLIEIGANYRIGEKFYLVSSIAYKHGFTQIANSDNTSKLEGTNYVFSLSLGLKYSLN